MIHTFPTANPWLRIAMPLLIFTVVGCVGLLVTNLIVSLSVAIVTMLLCNSAFSPGIQTFIVINDEFVAIHYLVGHCQYPLRDIVNVRDHGDGRKLGGSLRTNRIDIITKSGRPISLYPKQPSCLVRRLLQNIAESGPRD